MSTMEFWDSWTGSMALMDHFENQNISNKIKYIFHLIHQNTNKIKKSIHLVFPVYFFNESVLSFNFTVK